MVSLKKGVWKKKFMHECPFCGLSNQSKEKMEEHIKNIHRGEKRGLKAA